MWNNCEVNGVTLLVYDDERENTECLSDDEFCPILWSLGGCVFGHGNYPNSFWV